MEEYVNEETIVKNEKYESFKENIYCPICECLMIEPIMCFNCQNYFCKKCVEDWKGKNNNTCPNSCPNPVLKEVIGKNRLIAKFKFKCIKGCGAEIPFEEINNHYKSNCIKEKKENENSNKENKIKILTKEEMSKKNLKKNAKIQHMRSKIN